MNALIVMFDVGFGFKRMDGWNDRMMEWWMLVYLYEYSLHRFAREPEWR